MFLDWRICIRLLGVCVCREDKKAFILHYIQFVDTRANSILSSYTFWHHSLKTSNAFLSFVAIILHWQVVKIINNFKRSFEGCKVLLSRWINKTKSPCKMVVINPSQDTQPRMKANVLTPIYRTW